MAPFMTADVLRNRKVGQLDDDERALLEGALGRARSLVDGEEVARRGQLVDHSTLLLDGFMVRQIDSKDGSRHPVALHVPGEFVDLHAYPLERLDHDVAALGQARIATVSHAAIREALAIKPSLAMRLWTMTLLDAALHRQWVRRLSSLDATQRVAHFVCETRARLLATGRVANERFELPMTQSEIGEICSITNVHVSRVSKQLRDARLCEIRSGRVEVLNPFSLAKLCDFQPDYLYLEPAIHQQALGEPRSKA